MSLQRVPDPIEALLASLDADPRQAGEKYESLRRLLTKFFEWRDASSPLELADRALDRVGEKLAAGVQIENLNSYCHRVAYFIYLEWLNRQPESRQVPLDEVAESSLASPVAEDSASDAHRLNCQKRCLLTLSAETRELLRKYFAGQGRARGERREALAQQLGIHLDALYNRMTRLLRRLRECERTCLEKLSA